LLKYYDFDRLVVLCYSVAHCLWLIRPLWMENLKL
jgi:hypothetical protein